MLSVRRPIDAVSIAVGALLGALGAVQWRESGDFADHALQVTATLVDSRETKKQVLDAAPETYLRVEFSAARRRHRADRAPRSTPVERGASTREG